MNFITKHIAAVLAFAAISPITAFAHEGYASVDPALGSPAPISAATQVVTLQPGVHAVNVNRGDIVRFDVNGKTFVWQFDTLNTRNFDLAAIAPEEIQAEHIRVYVAENPLYRN